ncbi:MAG: hypothetical protein A3K19_02560 [Lentisphaerae bacterium RIFOXYB12_FULL_65_16]|nr:MAG: hypothetical protein A3K18_27930 [Lentisphaerae bacterium RIFOXYA12_64_32]OGV87617.1 MAG: hypothetical protein A3K19_02560 [Lentisphaerae bacterium RIFOXYB12_FULL_65_16]
MKDRLGLKYLAVGAAVAVWCAVFAPAGVTAGEAKVEPTDVKSTRVPPMPKPGAVAPATDPNRVVADVEGVKLVQGQVDAQVRQMLSARQLDDIPQQQVAKVLPMLRDKALQTLIGRVLLVKEVERQHIEIAPEQIDLAVERLHAKVPPGGTFEELLQTVGVSVDGLRQQLAFNLRIAKLLETQMAGKTDVTDAEIETFYSEHRDRFHEPEQVHARHILFKCDPNADAKAKQEKKAAAAAARQQLAEGMDFAALAKEKSECPSGKEGGDLGTFGRGAMAKEFEAAAFSQELNEIGPVVETTFGFHLIQVLEHTQAKDRTLPEARDEIAAYLTETKRRAALDGYIAQLQKAAKIVYPKATGPGATK